MPASAPSPLDPPVAASPEELRATLTKRHSVRLHVALILGACFVVRLAATKLLLLAAVFGAAAWTLYAASTILGDAGFAAHTRLAFLAVFAMAMMFAVVAQNAFPDALTFADVLRRI
jgi:hypothetical protein